MNLTAATPSALSSDPTWLPLVYASTAAGFDAHDVLYCGKPRPAGAARCSRHEVLRPDKHFRFPSHFLMLS